MRLRRIGFMAIAVILALGAGPSEAQTLYLDELFDFERTSAVVFASKPVSSPPVLVDLRAELYQPTGPGLPAGRPAIVAIHGGGFTSGSRLSSRMLEICEAMARRGWTCVSIEYRLLGDDPVVGPAFLPLEALLAAEDPVLATAVAAATEDTVAALDWLVAQAAPLGIDPQRIGLAGYSAGGVLTEIVGYMADDAGLPLPVPAKATFNMSGSFDPGAGVVAASEPALIASHGDQDATVPVAGALGLASRAASAGLPHALHVFPGRGHTDIDIFSIEVSPGETLFERFGTFFYTHVAQGAGPATPVPGLGGVAMGLLAAALLAATVPAFRGRTEAGGDT